MRASGKKFSAVGCSREDIGSWCRASVNGGHSLAIHGNGTSRGGRGKYKCARGDRGWARRCGRWSETRNPVRIPEQQSRKDGRRRSEPAGREVEDDGRAPLVGGVAWEGADGGARVSVACERGGGMGWLHATRGERGGAGGVGRMKRVKVQAEAGRGRNWAPERAGAASGLGPTGRGSCRPWSMGEGRRWAWGAFGPGGEDGWDKMEMKVSPKKKGNERERKE